MRHGEQGHLWHMSDMMYADACGVSGAPARLDHQKLMLCKQRIQTHQLHLRGSVASLVLWCWTLMHWSGACPKALNLCDAQESPTFIKHEWRAYMICGVQAELASLHAHCLIQVHRWDTIRRSKYLLVTISNRNISANLATATQQGHVTCR